MSSTNKMLQNGELEYERQYEVTEEDEDEDEDVYISRYQRQYETIEEKDDEYILRINDNSFRSKQNLLGTSQRTIVFDDISDSISSEDDKRGFDPGFLSGIAEGSEEKPNDISRFWCSVTVIAMAISIVPCIIAVSIVLLVEHSPNDNPSSGSKSSMLSPSIPQDMNSICLSRQHLFNVHNININNINDDVCDDVCLRQSCCFSSFNDCGDNDNKNDNNICQKYDICTSSISASVSEQCRDRKCHDMNNYCNKDMIKSSSQNLIQCRNICAPKMWCFVDKNNIILRDECIDYLPCLELMTNDDNDNINSDPNGTSSHTIALHEDDNNNNNNDDIHDLVNLFVRETCRMDAISSNEGYGKCQRLCSKQACCFLFGRNSCGDKESEWCDSFKECENLTHVIPHQ